MVMAILVVMASIALPRFGTAHVRYSMELAARRISADVAYAQSVARKKSIAQEIVFDQGSETYTFPGIDDADRAGVDYTVLLSDEPYGVDVVSVSFENGNGHIGDQRVRFDMWGRPESGDPNQGEAFAPLVDGSIVIGVGTDTRTITIAPVTGKVTIQ